MLLADVRNQTNEQLMESDFESQSEMRLRLALSIERAVTDNMLVSAGLDAAELARYNEQLTRVVGDLLADVDELQNAQPVVIAFVRGDDDDDDALGVELGMEIVRALEDHLNAAKG